MNVSIRSYLTAGVAVVGAGAIAFTPLVNPTLPDVQVPSLHAIAADVSLAAQPTNPIERWIEVIDTTRGNLDDLLAFIAEAPAPIAEQFLANTAANAQIAADGLSAAATAILGGLNSVPGALQATVEALIDGKIDEAWEAFLGPVLEVGFGALVTLRPVVEISQLVVQRVANVINVVVSEGTIAGLALAVGGLLLSPLNALVETGDQIVQGLQQGGLDGVVRAVNAVLNIPANLVDAVLNGAGSIPFPIGDNVVVVPAPGLLSPGLFGPGLGGGLFDTLQGLRVGIAEALAWVPKDALAKKREITTFQKEEESTFQKQDEVTLTKQETKPELEGGISQFTQVKDLGASAITLSTDGLGGGTPTEVKQPEGTGGGTPPPPPAQSLENETAGGDNTQAPSEQRGLRGGKYRGKFSGKLAESQAESETKSSESGNKFSGPRFSGRHAKPEAGQSESGGGGGKFSGRHAKRGGQKAAAAENDAA